MLECFPSSKNMNLSFMGSKLLHLGDAALSLALSYRPTQLRAWTISYVEYDLRIPIRDLSSSPAFPMVP